MPVKSLGSDFPADIRVGLEETVFENETWFKISGHNAMRPFFMSIVSDSNHWMFISSNGGITAGRRNPEFALFPYYTDDKITDSHETTGSKSIFQIHTDNGIIIWEPFSDRIPDYNAIKRNIFKSIYGNKIIFEEIHKNLNLVFRYSWHSSDSFGFVRKAEIINKSSVNYRITILDGIQNILPYGVPSDLQCKTSNLVDAYKRCELEPESGIGIFSLSAIIVDKAEPSEALKANIAWSLGLKDPIYLLSSIQLENFRKCREINEESDIKGEKGAYFACSEIILPENGTEKWEIIANVNQTHSQIIRLCKSIKEEKNLRTIIQDDINAGTERLITIVAGADGLQYTAGKLTDARHFSNVLFNVMRGGIFDDNYYLDKKDFLSYLGKANRILANEYRDLIAINDEKMERSVLVEQLSETENPDLIRHAVEYLPLRFSRRHGDPSRPWNSFSINTHNEADGSKILDYEGNWRDLFQNWEALACSYPGFTEGMIFKFLNASTFDGYNPYRVTKDGFDWEVLEHDNPWSYIGYWGDHQIIYMLKLLEISEKYHPGALISFFDKYLFVYAAVPYRLKSYEEILQNPRDTIVFDTSHDSAIRKLRDNLGADGALLTNTAGGIIHVNFIEKILASLLAKISNLIPEAGIWMNTQRPEWNDANNALVGNGASMVTLYYLYRYILFIKSLLGKTKLESTEISCELAGYYHVTATCIRDNRHLTIKPVSNRERKMITDQLGKAASEYRRQIYENGFSGTRCAVPIKDLISFMESCIDFISHSIAANQRTDKLFNAYNVITISDSEISYTSLEEMLEGQVAVLSSGYLTSRESLELLDALKVSSLFRKDQYSYILYPEKKLPGFLKKNIIPAKDAEASELIRRMSAIGDSQIVDRDVLGNYHFNGNFRNAADLAIALDALSDTEFRVIARRERPLLLDIFENVFRHRFFTGRSGTFFAYEGLGSIYWHMVSKLRLAVQETCLRAIEESDNAVLTGKLLDHYYEIDAGIGLHKSPELYGAFPTDPYSHTPRHRGAQQPGMTGQVKEDILARWGELGVFVREGRIIFNPSLLRREEFISETGSFSYYTTTGEKDKIQLNKGQLAFTFCQVPVVYTISDTETTSLTMRDKSIREIPGRILDRDFSNNVFSRTGKIIRIDVNVKPID